MSLSRWPLGLVLLLVVGILAPGAALAAKDRGKTPSAPAVDKDVQKVLDQLSKEQQQRKGVQDAQAKKLAAPAAGVFASIQSLSPCNVSIWKNPVKIEATGEVGVSAGEPRAKLIILILVVRNTKTQEFVLKNADSFVLSPGSGVCFLPVEQLWSLKPGAYQICFQVRSANSDGSETIHATKTCRFDKIVEVKNK